MINLPIADILRDSFRDAWRYKYLWLFGLFAGGGGGGGNQLSGSGEPTGIPDFDAAKAWIMAAAAMILLIIFTIGLVVLVLHVISKTALIYNTYQIETGGAHTLAGGWDFGWKRFWPMLGLTMLGIIVAIAWVLGIVIVEVAIFAIATPLGVLSLLVALPAFIAGLALVVLVVGYAERFLVLETRGVLDSLGDGWDLLRTQWKPTLLMGLAKLLIALAIGVTIMILGLMIAIPGIAMWESAKPLVILYGILFLLPFVLVAAYMGTFDSIAWTRTFLALRAPAYAAYEASAGAAGTTPPRADQPPPRPPLFE